MIKRNNKKGFTIVELVIVIAVIAILAAVLIPTFAGIIKKAQLSADQQAVRQMNTALAVDGAVTPTDIFDLHEVLSELGLTSEDYHPLTKDTYFFWDADLNRVLHVDENMTVITPAEYAGQTYVAGTSNWFSLTLEIEEEEIEGVTNNGTVTVNSGAQMQYVLNQLNEGSIKALNINLNGTIDMMGAVCSFPSMGINAGYAITLTGGTIKNATAVEYAQGATSTRDGQDGVYNCALFPSIEDGNSVTIDGVTIENMKVKNTNTGNIALLIGSMQGTSKKVSATIKDVTIKNSTVIGHRSTGALVGIVGGVAGSELNIEGTITFNNVDVKTVGGRSGMLVGYKNAAGAIDATGATIAFDKDCSYGIYECEQNTGTFDGKQLGLKDGKINSYTIRINEAGEYVNTSDTKGYLEKALVMTSSSDAIGETTDFYGATVTGWN